MLKTGFLQCFLLGRGILHFFFLGVGVEVWVSCLFYFVFLLREHILIISLVQVKVNKSYRKTRYIKKSLHNFAFCFLGFIYFNIIFFCGTTSMCIFTWLRFLFISFTSIFFLPNLYLIFTVISVKSNLQNLHNVWYCNVWKIIHGCY